MEILVVLYTGILRVNPEDAENPDRDRFFISKAHGVLAYYTALEKRGYLSDDDLESFERDEGTLAGHPVRDLSRGIEYSGGSLGMAFSVGIGQALAAKHDGRPSHIYVLLGDGECDEGANWEAFLSAPNWKLNNLTVIIDANQLQYDGPTANVMNLSPLADKLRAFNWEVLEVDGHNVRELYEALSTPDSEKPRVIIAHTVKGKGVSFMEGVKEWHHSVLNDKNYEAALREFEVTP